MSFCYFPGIGNIFIITVQSLPGFQPNLVPFQRFETSEQVPQNMMLPTGAQGNPVAPAHPPVPREQGNSVQEPPESRERQNGKPARMSNPDKVIQSAKKNGESNILNQLFASIAKRSSGSKIVENAISLLRHSPTELQNIKTIFYNSVGYINYKRGRKYTNRHSIRKLFTPQGFRAEIPEIEEKLAENGSISVEELSFLFRVVVTHFVRSESINALLTSRRVSMLAKKDHLVRRRRVAACFQGLQK